MFPRFACLFKQRNITMRINSITPHQKQILADVKRLNPKRLYYLVVQQNRIYPNLSLNELKKHIKRGIKNYTRELLGIDYFVNAENKIIQYYCFFETSKDFYWSQQKNFIPSQVLFIDLHFHLFVSSNYSSVHIPQLIQYIFRELTSQRIKNKAILKFDYKKINVLEDNFILYHTKQQEEQGTQSMMTKNL